MNRLHHHPCQAGDGCRNKVECRGTWEDNWDGWPPAICDAFHLPDGRLNPDCICDDCKEKRHEFDETDLALGRE